MSLVLEEVRSSLGLTIIENFMGHSFVRPERSVSRDCSDLSSIAGPAMPGALKPGRVLQWNIENHFDIIWHTHTHTYKHILTPLGCLLMLM